MWAMAKTASWQPVTAEPWVQSQASWDLWWTERHLDRFISWVCLLTYCMFPYLWHALSNYVLTACCPFFRHFVSVTLSSLH